jgi:hypothetical protein
MRDWHVARPHSRLREDAARDNLSDAIDLAGGAPRNRQVSSAKSELALELRQFEVLNRQHVRPRPQDDGKDEDHHDEPAEDYEVASPGDLDAFAGSIGAHACGSLRFVLKGRSNTKISSEGPHREWPDLVCCILLLDDALIGSVTMIHRLSDDT